MATSIFNSKGPNNDAESDITIINESIIDEKSTNFLPKTSNFRSDERSTGSLTGSSENHENSDYIYVEQDRQQFANELNTILQQYADHMKQENRTQFECSKQLVIRLLDVIRPAYTNEKEKIVSLKNLEDEINSLHDKLFVESKDQVNQLQKEINELRTRIVSFENETNQIVNYPTSLMQRESFEDVGQWVEIEDDTKKLQEVIKGQQERINQILDLINQAGIDPASVGISEEIIHGANASAQDAGRTKDKTNENSGQAKPSSLFKKFNNAFNSQISNPDLNNDNQEEELRNSPGTSPTHTFTTLTEQVMEWASAVGSEEELKQSEDKNQEENKNRIDQNPRAKSPIPPLPQSLPTADAVVTPTTAATAATRPIEEEPVQYPVRACIICFQNFPERARPGVPSIYDHLEVCLSSTEPKRKQPDLECPVCQNRFPASEENDYHQHINDCFNEN